MSVPSWLNVKSVHPLLWQACNDAVPMSILSGDGGTLYTSISMALSLPLFLTHILTHPHTPSHTLTHPHTPSHFLSCEIPLGDIQSEEERDIVLELKLPVLPSPQPDATLVTTLSYFNVITSALDTLTTELTVNRTGTCLR